MFVKGGISQPNIRAFGQEELKEVFKSLNEPAYRASQVYEWMWYKNAAGFDEMTNLPKGLRKKLTQSFAYNKIQLAETQKSEDGTFKHAFKTFDGKIIEGVLIPTENRMTACISSQVGCSLSCKFCATGKLKRLRNLSSDEIYDQVWEIKKTAEKVYDKPLTNIVYMGMGEPLLNYHKVLASIEKITDAKGIGFSPKRITVSTAGIAKQIINLADDGVKFNLALSLHAANEEKRSQIMPINEQNSLESLKEALRYYCDKTNAKVTFEYIIFKDFNDSIRDADELMRFCGVVPSKVNIIEYNPIDDAEFEQADPEKVDTFVQYLQGHGVVAKVRRSRGKDIDAACGQLANKNGAIQKLS